MLTTLAKRGHAGWSAWVLTVVAVGLLRCGGSEPRFRNLLLISIDTLRPDHLGCYGHPGGTSPAIDALASDGVRFERAYSTVPITLPAHTSMMTGTIPPMHGVRDNAGYRVPRSETTLAEILREQGFRTGAVVGAFVLDSQFGLDQGFASYDDRFDEVVQTNVIAERRAEEVRLKAESWLQQQGDDPFFLFVHFYDPHLAYEPPEPFRSRFADDPYSGEVAYVDEQVGLMLEFLESRGLADSTLVVLTSDHGEMLGEHGEPSHTYFVYESAIRVPLIVRGPGIAAGRIDAVAGLIDLVPTVCALLGLERPVDVQGEDLSVEILGGAAPAGGRERYAESMLPTKYGANPLFALVGERWKYIHTTRPELYDLDADPTESSNLIDAQPRQAAESADRLLAILRERPEGPASEGRSAVSSEVRERLQSLGYVGGRAADLVEIEPSRDDPKDQIGFHVEYATVPHLFEQGRLDEADERLTRLLARRPGFAEGHLFRARIAGLRGDLEATLGHFDRALAADPTRADLHSDLGSALAAAGKSASAQTHFLRALELDPESIEAQTNLANLLLGRGEIESAIERYEAVVKLQPDSSDARVNLGLALLQAGRSEQAVQLYREALEIEPRSVRALLGLGAASAARGDLDAAIESYVEATVADPGSASAYYNLGVALRARGRIDEGIGQLQRAIEVQPDFAKAHLQLARSWVALDRLDEAFVAFGDAIYNDKTWAAPKLELAWIRAVHPVESIRDPSSAVVLAEEALALALRGPDEPAALESIAAAYAATGRFDRAVQAAEAALAYGRTPGPTEARLRLYREGQAYIAPGTGPRLLLER